MDYSDVEDQGLRLAIERAGSKRRLAVLIGVSNPAVVKWTRIPSAEFCLVIEASLGIPRSVLRPDLYPPEREASLLPQQPTRNGETTNGEDRSQRR